MATKLLGILETSYDELLFVSDFTSLVSALNCFTQPFTRRDCQETRGKRRKRKPPRRFPSTREFSRSELVVKPFTS
jgi:hypothetical protein